MSGDHCRSRSSHFQSFKFSEAPNLLLPSGALNLTEAYKIVDM